MEDKMFIVLLCLSVNNVCGISMMSRNQTWNEAFNDSSCTMIGLNLTGNIAESIDDITTDSISWGTVQSAWIGAYARRVWINFEGCFYGRFKPNHSWMNLTVHDDPAKSCLKHCNYSEFVLAEDKCVCPKDVYRINTGCKPRNCTNTKYRYCGDGTVEHSYITYHCMCRFSMVNDANFISDKGNCLAVTFKPQQEFTATNCSNPYRPICYNPANNQTDLNRTSTNWLQSFSECYDNNKQFAGGTTKVSGIHTGTYWVGTFALIYKLWGRPGAASNSCVAVSKDRHKLSTVVLPCDTVLPTLCLNSSPSILPTTETNIPDKSQDHSLTSTLRITSTYRPSTSVVSATQNSNTEGNTNRLPSSTSKGPQYGPAGNIQTLISTTVVQAIGIIEYPSTTQTRIPISTTRGPNEGTSKMSNNLLLSTSTTERPVSGTVGASSNKSTQILTIVGPVVGVVVILSIIVVGLLLLRRRGMFRKSPATDDKTTADLEMRNPSKLDQADADEAIHHDVYNHLGEIKTKQQMSAEDLYDHTGGLKYDRLNENNNHTGNESNYDHTDGTYGRLHADKYRDVCDDMYDHIGDTYGRLHVSKYQDDVDGVYDHTGRLGSTYGHINMVKPEEDCEYDHTRVTHKKTQPEVNSDYDYTRVTHEHRQPKVDSDYDHTFYTP